jgi:hypothetical protein
MSAVLAIADYQVRTHNSSEHSQNRIHSDDVARQFGFKGGLVPGVTVFAHMTRPLVARYGIDWLARAIAEVKLAKPAYENDLLTVRTADAGGAGNHELICVNEQGIELARMTSGLHAASVAPDPRTAITPAPPIADKPVVSWDLMEIGKPFPALAWTPTRDDNLQWCDDVRDDLALYRDGASPLLHPGFILRQANHVLRERFVLPAWIHAGSRITFHEASRVGPHYEVRAIPEEKWRTKGHEIARLYVAIRNGDRTVAEVLHTAIFNPRKSG